MDGLQWARRSLKEEGLSPKLQLSCHNQFTFTFSALRCDLKAFTICEWDVTASFKSNLPKQNANFTSLELHLFCLHPWSTFPAWHDRYTIEQNWDSIPRPFDCEFSILKKFYEFPRLCFFDELVLTNSRTIDLSFFYENFLPTKVHVTSFEFGFREEYFQDSVSSQIFLGI